MLELDKNPQNAPLPRPAKSIGSTSQAQIDAKPARAKNKRNISSADSCIRTDLLDMCPNARKALAIDHMLLHCKDASTQMGQSVWAGLLSGIAVKVAWKTVAASNALAGRSTILKAAEAQVRGVLASHLGWLEKDAGRKINTIARRLNKRIMERHEGDCSARKSEVARLDGFIHELRAVNSAHAWNWAADRQQCQTVMKADGKHKTASPRSYESSRKLFSLVQKQRSFPNLSRCQIESTRGGVKLCGTGTFSAGIPDSILKQLSLTLEQYQDSASPFGYWARLTVDDPSLDGLAPAGALSILILAQTHTAFDLRNSGTKGKHAGAKGGEGFLIHPMPKKNFPKKGQKAPMRIARLNVEKKVGKLNPAKIGPEAVESLPRIALEKHLFLKQSGIRFPTLWSALRSRPKGDISASAAAGSSAADGGVKSFAPSKKEPASVSEALVAGRLPTFCH